MGAHMPAVGEQGHRAEDDAGGDLGHHGGGGEEEDPSCPLLAMSADDGEIVAVLPLPE